jgi:TonB family protein
MIRQFLICAAALTDLAPVGLYFGVAVLGAQVTDSIPVVLNSREASSLILREVKPEYPPLAKINYIQGSVRVQLRITREGRVAEAHVIRGHPFLAEEALNAVRRWAYRPLKTGGAKAEFFTFVDVNFSLRRHRVERFPPQPERDLDRQVQPPAVVQKPGCCATASLVPMRVLVGADGRVIDSRPVSGWPATLRAARKSLEEWKFQPAHWGNHPVPWYLDVEVPAEAMPAIQSGAVPVRR